MKNRKIKVLLGALIVLVLCIGLFMKNKTSTLNNSSINKESVTKELDDNLIGAYIQEGEEYIQTDDIPSSGYEFNKEKSYCKIGDTVQEDITLFYDMDTQTITVSPITKEGLKCYLYFDEKASAGDTILASENAPTNSTTDWTNGGKGITYYYTGNPNNWVSFAGLWWRIIRINGDGSIRMIYQGTTPNMTGANTQIGTSAFNSIWEGTYDDVGYMYEIGQQHGLSQSSIIKNTLDEWYTNNLGSKNFDDYIDKDAGFCGDRRITSSPNGTYYLPDSRIDSNNPDLSCETLDIYTISESVYGNKSLLYPIGLISADEAMLAGLPNINSSGNTNNYLYTGQIYWTMSPSYYFGDAFVFYVSSSGNVSSGALGMGNVSSTNGVRPVINIRADVSITGLGTTTDPFKIVGAS